MVVWSAGHGDEGVRVEMVYGPGRTSYRQRPPLTSEHCSIRGQRLWVSNIGTVCLEIGGIWISDIRFGTQWDLEFGIAMSGLGLSTVISLRWKKSLDIDVELLRTVRWCWEGSNL